MPRDRKLYVLSRADLPPGLQAAQAAHAAFQFAVEHPLLTEAWHSGSNYLILLSVPDEQSIVRLADDLRAVGVAFSLVREPDVGDEATALAVEPSPCNAWFSHLPLLGRAPGAALAEVAA